MWLDDMRPLRLGASADDDRLDEAAFRPFGLDGRRVAGDGDVTESVRAVLPFGQLRTFRTTPTPRRRVLVVAPIAGGFPFLMRDLVVALLSIADEVAITEWPNVRYVPRARGAFGFGENCVETAQMVRALGADPETGANGPRVHVVGVCQGGLPALAAACLLADCGLAPLSLTLMGAPADPSRNPTRLWRVLQERSLPALEAQVMETISGAFPGAGRRVFPAWRQVDTFALYLWRQSISGGDLPLRLAFDEGDDPLRFPLARLCWTMMDVPGEFFMENVATIFRENALARGTLAIDGHPAHGASLSDTALLTVEGEIDDIAGPGQTEAAHDLCPNVPGSLRRHLQVPGVGHFALFYGRHMRQTVLPAIAEAMAAGESIA